MSGASNHGLHGCVKGTKLISLKSNSLKLTVTTPFSVTDEIQVQC